MTYFEKHQYVEEQLLVIAQRHKILRKRAKISQEAMAEISGVSLGSLKRFERSGQISLESLVKLVKSLGKEEDLDCLFK